MNEPVPAPHPEVVLSPDVVERVRAAVLWMDGLTVRRSDEAYRELSSIAESFRREHEGKTVGQVDGVGAARRLYRSFGIDPTSTRPSSEALLKRALKGNELYHLNNIVDWGNAVSLRSLLPLGLYDRDHVIGDLAVIREGNLGEEYPGIRKGPVHVGGRLCIADEQGAFGSPTSDSHRARIRETTTAILVVVFAPLEAEEERLRAAVEMLADGFTRHAGGREQGRRFLETH